MSIDYYTFITIERAVCSAILVYALFRKGAGPFLLALALFFGAFVGSLGLFYARTLLDPEFEQLLINIGTGLQGAALLAAVVLWRLKKFG